MTAVTIATGSVIRLKGASRNYTAVVTRSEPNRIWVRIGDDWENCFDYEITAAGGEWVGRASRPGRAAPKTRIVGVLNRSEHIYVAKG